MDAIKAIPKKLLIHTATHSREADADRWGTAEQIESSELKYVRIEPSSRIVRDKSNAEIQLVATLFYDCRNSLPRGVQFAEDDIISFNGLKHRVASVEPLYDGERLHHYEMGLVKHV